MTSCNSVVEWLTDDAGGVDDVIR